MMLSMFCLLNVEDCIDGFELRLGFDSVFQVLKYHLFFGVELNTADYNHSIHHILPKGLLGMLDVSASLDPARLLKLN